MARTGTAARRYAEAAFELAERDNALDRWRDDLRTAATLLGEKSVARVVSSQMVAVAEREALVEQLLASRISKGALNLVKLLLRRGTLDSLGRISSEYQRLLNLRRGVVSAVVTSALPLDANEDAALRERVGRMTGSTVEIETRVDPALIGGLTVRIGDRLIDASVRGRLERLREQLVAGTRQAG
ncbi:MAG TPA: F0F1 ATP synthase subunit delta [Candidatus Saccharimonadales bacterium]|nr:F0F1 ATP synthase subunit delta [Candidatus Saccharimonadales bacterium]